MTDFVLNRRQCALLAGAVTLLASPSLWAGSYLDRASMILVQSEEELVYLQARLEDKELAQFVHRMAIARLESASKMIVPKEVAQAHPHLLLMLENCERAAQAAVERRQGRFKRHLRLARDEERLFTAVMRQLGWKVPDFRPY